jgi:hypothetical protein
MLTGNRRKFIAGLLLQYPALARANSFDGIRGVNRDGISALTRRSGPPAFVPTADGIPADVYADFVNGNYWGTSLAAIDAALTRNTVAWGDYANGTWVQFPAGVPVITDTGWQTQVVQTNYALQCRGLLNAVWVKNPAGTTAQNQIGIDGVINSASLISANAANCTVLQSITLASATYIYSVFLKRLAGTGAISITMDGGATWTNVASQINSTSWSRVQIQETLANPTIGIQVATSGDQVAVDFNQLEITNTSITMASSPIATTTASVFRSADRFQLPMTVGSAITILGVGTPRSGEAGNITWLTMSDGSNANRIAIFKAATVARGIFVPNGTVTNIVPGGTITWPGNGTAQGKLIQAATAGDQAVSFNGQAIGTGTATPFPTALDELDMGQFNTATGWWTTARFAIWLNHRATNAELMRLTT